MGQRRRCRRSGTLPGSRKGDGASSGAFEAFADQAVLLREEDLVFRTLLVPLLRHGFEQKAAALAVLSGSGGIP